MLLSTLDAQDRQSAKQLLSDTRRRRQSRVMVATKGYVGRVLARRGS
jgi:hypothetical protein